MKPGQANAITKVKEVVEATSSKSLTAAASATTRSRRSGSPQGARLRRARCHEDRSGPIRRGNGNSAFIILILLLFLMINRENMSDRLIRVFGHGKISLTTRTIEEVGPADQQVPGHVRRREFELRRHRRARGSGPSA